MVLIATAEAWFGCMQSVFSPFRSLAFSQQSRYSFMAELDGMTLPASVVDKRSTVGRGRELQAGSYQAGCSIPLSLLMHFSIAIATATKRNSYNDIACGAMLQNLALR